MNLLIQIDTTMAINRVEKRRSFFVATMEGMFGMAHLFDGGTCGGGALTFNIYIPKSGNERYILVNTIAR